jgi:hypothetical protein
MNYRNVRSTLIAFSLIAAALASGSAVSASAQASYTFSGSTITGVSNVLVGGVSYDVSFMDGLYSNLQPDPNGSFAYALSTALNQIPWTAYAFQFAGGTGAFNGFYIVTGNGADTDPSVGWRGPVSAAYLVPDPSGPITGGLGFGNFGQLRWEWTNITQNNYDTANTNLETTAQWSLSTPVATAPIPEADTYALMALGMGLVGFMARRRKA